MRAAKGVGTLILHWTGTVWEQAHSPNPTSDHGENLTGIAATSARNAWVVGYAPPAPPASRGCLSTPPGQVRAASSGRPGW